MQRRLRRRRLLRLRPHRRVLTLTVTLKRSIPRHNFQRSTEPLRWEREGERACVCVRECVSQGGCFDSTASTCSDALICRAIALGAPAVPALTRPPMHTPCGYATTRPVLFTFFVLVYRHSILMRVLNDGCVVFSAPPPPPPPPPPPRAYPDVDLTPYSTSELAELATRISLIRPRTEQN
jgi:hypothetical protein